MTALPLFAACDARAIGLDPVGEGPFLMRTRELGLVVNFAREKSVARLDEARRSIAWSRGLPPAAKAGLQVFALDPSTYTLSYLGRGSLTRSTARGAVIALPEAIPEALARTLSTRPVRLPDPLEGLLALTRSSAADARLDALAPFIERWWEPTAVAPTQPSASLPSLPTPLVRLHAQVERYRVFSQNSLTVPGPAGTLEPDASEDDGDRMMRTARWFYHENQGVFRACFFDDDPEPADPQAWILESDWTCAEERLSGFLTQCVLAEAVWGGPLSGRGGSAPLMRQVRKKLHPLPFGRWVYGATFWAGEGVLAMIVDDEEPMVFAAAANADDWESHPWLVERLEEHA